MHFHGQANRNIVWDSNALETARAFTAYPGGHNEGYPDSFKMCFKAFYDYIAAADFDAPPFFPTFDTQTERAAAYEHYQRELLARPYLVGAHWYQYFDQPAL